MAAPFFARAVLSGDITERRLCELLWPEYRPNGEAVEPEMETLIYSWDDLLDYRDRLTRRQTQRLRDSAQLADLDPRSGAAAAALAEGDVERAIAALTH